MSRGFPSMTALLGLLDPENGRQHKSRRIIVAGRDEFRDHAGKESNDDRPHDLHGEFSGSRRSRNIGG
jgi:hypothetical protein